MQQHCSQIPQTCLGRCLSQANCVCGVTCLSRSVRYIRGWSIKGVHKRLAQAFPPTTFSLSRSQRLCEFALKSVDERVYVPIRPLPVSQGKAFLTRIRNCSRNSCGMHGCPDLAKFNSQSYIIWDKDTAIMLKRNATKLA